MKTQRRVLKCEERCNVGREYEETRSGRSEPGTLEFPWESQAYEETRRYRKPRHRRYWQDLATQSPYIYCLRTTYWEGFLERETKIWSQPRRQKMENLDVNAAIWGTVMSVTLQSAVDLGRDNSRIYGSTRNQSMRFIETVDSSYWETDHGSDRNYKCSSDRLAAANVAKGQPCWLTRQSSSRVHKPMSFPIQCCDWEASVQTPSEHGRTRLICSWNHISLEKGIESTWSRWSSSGIFSQDSLQ